MYQLFLKVEKLIHGAQILMESLVFGNTANALTVTKALEKVTEISLSGHETLMKDVNGKVYAAGLNNTGALGIGNLTNAALMTEITTLGNITGDSKVKYIKAGRSSSTVMLENGMVYLVRRKYIRRVRRWNRNKFYIFCSGKN